MEKNPRRSGISRLFSVYLDLMRSRMKKIFGWPICTLVGAMIAAHGHPPLVPTVITMISMFTVATSVYLYNDVVDREMDGLNPKKKDRPLPSGRVSVDDAMKIIYVNGLIGLALIVTVGFYAALLMLGYFMVFMAYSYPPIYIKRRFPFKEITIAGGGIFSATIGSMTVGTISSTVVLYGLVVFGFTYLSLPVFADAVDVYEDKKYGIKTMSMVLSWRKWLTLFVGFLFLLMILTPFTWMRFDLNILYPIIVVGSCLILLRYLIPLSRGIEDVLFNRAVKAFFAFWMLWTAAGS